MFCLTPWMWYLSPCRVGVLHFNLPWSTWSTHKHTSYKRSPRSQHDHNDPHKIVTTRLQHLMYIKIQSSKQLVMQVHYSKTLTLCVFLTPCVLLLTSRGMMVITWLDERITLETKTKLTKWSKKGLGDKVFYHRKLYM
jgi:hypothetical protein